MNICFSSGFSFFLSPFVYHQNSPFLLSRGSGERDRMRPGCPWFERTAFLGPSILWEGSPKAPDPQRPWARLLSLEFCHWRPEHRHSCYWQMPSDRKWLCRSHFCLTFLDTRLHPKISLGVPYVYSALPCFKIWIILSIFFSFISARSLIWVN